MSCDVTKQSFIKSSQMYLIKGLTIWFYNESSLDLGEQDIITCKINFFLAMRYCNDQTCNFPSCLFI